VPIRVALVAIVAALMVGGLVVTPTAQAANGFVTVVVSGNGSGRVTDNFGYINCGGPACYYSLPAPGDPVLTATPATGSVFSGWSANSNCDTLLSTTLCYIAVQANETTYVDAVFSLLPETLTVAKEGDGTGTVTTTPTGIDCGATCSHSYDYGSSVTLSVAADQGSTFGGWSGACTGKAFCVLSMQAGRSVAATFLKDCVVPKLRGKSLSRARGALLAHDCTVGTITRVSSTTVKRGHVISQTPIPGRQRLHGARVSLVISKGRR